MSKFGETVVFKKNEYKISKNFRLLGVCEVYGKLYKVIQKEKAHAAKEHLTLELWH